MDFEFDAEKSRTNKSKHGIDFNEAKRLWESRTIELNSKNPSQPRRLVIGVVDEVHWTAIITYRGENIRLIPVRRSRNEEKEIYKRNYR